MRRENVFTPEGFYPTGDLVRVDEDGYLYFLARRIDMTVIGLVLASAGNRQYTSREQSGDFTYVAGVPAPEKHGQ